MHLSLSSLVRFEEHAWFLLRAGVGTVVAYHGYPYFVGGMTAWRELGRSMALNGVVDNPMVWGLVAAVAEFFGGILVAAGLFTRVAAFVLTVIFATGGLAQLRGGSGFYPAPHELVLALVFLFAVIKGSGRFGIDAKFDC